MTVNDPREDSLIRTETCGRIRSMWSMKSVNVKYSDGILCGYVHIILYQESEPHWNPGESYPEPFQSKAHLLKVFL